MQTDFRGWIKSEGVEKIAARLKVEPNTVYSWSHRNRIPYRLWSDVVLAFSEVGLNDLRAMNNASILSDRK